MGVKLAGRGTKPTRPNTNSNKKSNGAVNEILQGKSAMKSAKDCDELI